MAPRPGIYTPAGQRGEHARPGRGIDVAAAEWGRARPRGATCMRRRRPGPALLRSQVRTGHVAASPGWVSRRAQSGLAASPAWL
jgi:hypothetical protein